MINIDNIEANIGYSKIPDEWVVQLCAEVRRLRETIRLQANAARSGMDAAKRAATILYAEADKARAESSPELLASERAMNAMLTAENERLQAFHDFFRDRCEGLYMQFGMAAVDAYNEAARQNNKI
jgi:hypothetical protein